MEKSGFVYIWYDNKRKMYYIGSHWGTIDDGYICSSKWMRDAYRYRSFNFKRRIIKTAISRENLLIEENKWLSMIPNDQLGRKYYNLTKSSTHWQSNNEKRKLFSDKIKENWKKLSDEEKLNRAKNISEGKQKRKTEKLSLGLPIYNKTSNWKPVHLGKKQSEESNIKRSQSLKKAFIEGKTIGNKGKKITWSDERKVKHQERMKTADHSRRDSTKYSEGNKKAWDEGKFNNRKSNNMKNYIWVHEIATRRNTRILKTSFDPNIYNIGRINIR